MTVKEYLRQAYLLDKRIDSDIAEAAALRQMASGIHSPGFEEHYNPNRSNEAPFVRSLEKVWEMEQNINDEIDRLVDLKAQICSVIDRVKDPRHRLILKYRYVHSWTWERIGSELCADERTIRRWHGDALASVTLPENPIKI